jgi:uncharacterized membrane protein YeiB
MKQETKRLSSIIIAALLLAAALMVYFEFITSAYTNLQLVKGQEESETTLYANEQQVVSKVKSLLTTYKNDASSSQAVAMALPVGSDVSGALAQIYGIAANANVTIQGTQISTQAVQAVTASAGSIVKPTGTVSFQVTGSTSYESFKSFLQGLETNIRVFDVTTISLQPATVVATKTQAANADMFNYTVTIVTHYQGS